MKDDIIAIAIRLLRHGGYDNLTFALIADELNTTRANLHHHFKNKEGLAEAALLSYVDEEEQRLNHILEKSDGDLLAILSALEDHLIDLAMMDRDQSACIGSQLLRDGSAPLKLKKIAMDRFRAEADLIRLQVEKHLQSERLDQLESAEALTFQIVSHIHGIDMMGLIERDQKKLARDIKGSLVGLIP